MITLREIADSNWCSRYTFIRKLQCDIFGHRHSNKVMGMFSKSNPNSMWCAWCGRSVDRLKP
jgi:hypothetical protein